MIESHEVFLDVLGKGYVLRGDALSEWVSSESDDLDAFVTEFDNDQQIESTDEQRIKLIAEALDEAGIAPPLPHVRR
ncbi:hypothetical protein [Gordonia sp. (in: high G+C Gram-positive bacteria)]|jgi:hypothetical protein|uniref:hypothetical protein n=1 Tax=Gordonia sp. (in: high G+C Gram-positive bacteria) TaxID=84139 RepID=UPI0025BFB966|nr:hypothetical protein [Gordonia sp. (in: high G+C Gram-positive bacteria)]HMS74624.1 hypothetical protein [Gordonia sp. (in: high G+C Gram-positive bacteria)]